VGVEGDAVDDGGDEAGVGEDDAPLVERQAQPRCRPQRVRLGRC